MANKLQLLAKRLAKVLDAGPHYLVLAESCTGGLVAASLAQVPGVSRNLCGSMVTYQDVTKQVWLQIPESLLLRSGAVSETVAGWMSERVLANTPHADVSAAVTGHLGPQAPAKFDGIVFVAVSLRLRTAGQVVTSVVRHQLQNSSRLGRQNEASRLVLEDVLEAIASVAR